MGRGYTRQKGCRVTIKMTLRNRWFWLVVSVCGLLTWMGYDRLIPPKYYPVEGTVLLDGEPFVPPTGYRVYFTPIPAGRDRYSSRCWGEVDTKGRYRLVTEITTLVPEQGPHGQRIDTFAGAALGWYEVTITGLLESVSEPAGGDPMADRLRKVDYPTDGERSEKGVSSS